MTSKIRAKKAAVGFIALVAVAFSPLTLIPVSGQVVGATLSGTISDQSGAVIPGGRVTIKNVATGVSRDVSADSAGFYTAPNLLPGSYEVTISSPGFATEVRSGITLTVGAQQVLNLSMRVGQVTEKIQITGEAPAVQLASSSLSAVVGASTVVELPLNGRSWTDLARLQPGVAAVETQVAFGDSGRGNRGFGAQLSISGGRPTQNNYRLDGISINDYANGGPGSVLGGNLGVDAIQEFSVVTSNYSADYGKTSGGVVNAISRSGTNQLHGSAYFFLRDEDFDARRFFDTTRPSFHQNQYGASAGGPIKKDRTFVFGDFEGINFGEGCHPAGRCAVCGRAQWYSLLDSTF
jgi:Carboxypeptidase regulatory-like domain/TonB-dependent Receptor Plug Domain